MQMIKLKKPILIAEIGINHNGSIELAKKMIDLASKYKMDVVKFQKGIPTYVYLTNIRIFIEKHLGEI